ncbi:MAG: hypothetical protein PVJ57_14780 [Phycisphaerae bacterium]
MSEPSPPAESAPPPAPAARRGGSPWILVGLLVLLGGWFVVTQFVSHTGPKIAWIENDYPRAEREARAHGRRIFLLLYEPDCPVTAGLDRGLFTQREVRERLAKMVCCRIKLTPGDPLRGRFDFKRSPQMMVFEPGKDEPVGRPLNGSVELREFQTYVDPGDVP